MAKYQVVRPWFGVAMGQIVTLKEVHPALRANVMLVSEGAPKESDAAAKVLDAARAEAQSIIDAAKAEGQAIIDAARAEVESLIASEVAETASLTPATPDATSDKPKATPKGK
ncbi:hypothetical protein [Eoetvoesiella caeni]|uniref:Uncharacterized protein n=1 Tax=Eoetvoesiella caeni TaxID=645616 RepID=A0A366HAL2_9BURK|nr:hypothetical protein [Eoetvoesiella caeni]MCI2809385.1 hypothetical protein [Eoetvoesiella caeni]NYT54526.1 hypothetical protein [Eoetvoesiella caeni]RBP39284.1 hypothetical protein DFR37_10575 [Eoetvoesiella caeni]